MRPIRGGLAALLAVCTFDACSSDSPKGNGYADATRYDAGAATDASGDGGGGSGGGGTGGGGGPTEKHLRMSMLKEVKPDDGSAGTLDLVIYDLDDKREANLTASANGGVDCRSRQCLVNHQMTWIGWLEHGATGLDLYVAPIDTVHYTVDMAQKRKVDETVQSFEFTNDGTRDLIVYTQGEAVGAGASLQVKVQPVAPFDQAACDAGGSAEDLSACPQLAGAINGNGSFRVTSFGALIILLRTDLSSMTVSFFNVSNGASQALTTFGSMNGTGSQFSGNLPVALSPDASYLAVATKDEFLWKLFNLAAKPNPGDPTKLEMYETEGNRGEDCARPAPFNFNDIYFDPKFDPSGDHIFILATGNCSLQSHATNRNDFDILRIDKSMDPASVVSVTKIPRLNSGYNHQITSYDVSPDGEKIAFTAPRPNDNQSQSVWIVGADPNVADGPKYDCGPHSTPAVGEDGKSRCEFLFEDVDHARVIYRNVRFHEVEVSAN